MDVPAKKKSPWLWILIATLSLAVFVFLNFEDLKHRIMIASTRASIEMPVTIPFTFERGLIIIEPELKGSTLKMILDSAAFETRLTADTAADLGINASINNQVGDTFGRSATMGIATLPALSLGNATWQRATAGLLNWGRGALTPCVAKDGIIGGTTMRHASWLIDFEAKQLHIGKPNELPKSFETKLKLERIPFTSSRVALSPKVSIEVNGQEVKNILIDTGSNGGLVLPRALLSELGITEENWIYVQDEASTGIFGVTEVSAVLAPVQLKLGASEAFSVYAEFTDDSEAKIGTKVLSQFLIAIVPNEKSLYLAKTQATTDPINPPLQHGFIPALSDEGDAWIVVYREQNWQESQSTTVDPLAVGSRFNKINGLKAEDAFKNHCEVFLGIRDFIDKPQLSLERDDASQLILNSNTR